jgi:hypothetical protein
VHSCVSALRHSLTHSHAHAHPHFSRPLRVSMSLVFFNDCDDSSFYNVAMSVLLSDCEIHEGLTTESFKLAGLDTVSARCFSLVAPSRTLVRYSVTFRIRISRDALVRFQ